MSRTVALATPPPPGLQEAIKLSTSQWQQDMESLFKNAKDRFPDVVWEFSNDPNCDDEDMGTVGFNHSYVNGYDDEDRRRTVMTTLNKAKIEEVWGHKAIVYARAPPSFQSRYFSFRPNGASVSALPFSSDYHTEDDHSYPAESSVSLGTTLEVPAPGSLIARTPSPGGLPTATPTSAQSNQALLRIHTNISPALFSNELEYLYTGQGLGEAFEFLFDSSEHAGLFGDGGDGGSEAGDGPNAEALRIDKLRKDLVFMWRSRLYSDVRIALTGNFASSNGTHENTTAIFSSHRFILASRAPYFHDALLGGFGGPGGAKGAITLSTSTNGEPPTLTLPSPPFTPASLHFTLGYIYTGTLIFSHRTYDLSTAFAILRAALYLGITTLQDEIQARIANEMLHGLFHAFLPFAEYEKLTGSKWGVGGCRCRQCARRVPRVLEFSLAEDVKNLHLERGSRRALVGLFGEGWCHPEFASLSPKLRESLLKGLAKRTTPPNVWPLLWAVEHALIKLGPVIEPWADVVKENLFSARKTIDETICRESEVCFGIDEWIEIMENEGAGFEDGQKVEWAMAAVLRGVKEPSSAVLYQTLVASILLRPHPTEDDQPLLSATSHIRVEVEQTRLELLKWIGKRWIGIRQEQGFDNLEGWALKEISDYIEVPIDDMFNPDPQANAKGTSRGPHQQSPPRNKTQSTFLRPASQHPHTSRIDANSDAASSMRASLLTRNTGTSTTHRSGRDRSDQSSIVSSIASRRRDRPDNASIVSSVRSVARSTATFESAGSGGSASTVGVPRRRTTTGLSVASSSVVSSRHGAGLTLVNPDDPSERMGVDGVDSPAKRIAASARTRMEKDRDRPDSKLTPVDVGVGRRRSESLGRPSIVASSYDSDESGDGDYTREEEGEDGQERRDDRANDSDQSVDGDSTSTAGLRVRGAGKREESLKRTPTKSSMASTSTRRTTLSNASTSTAPIKKTVITRASLASVTSRGTVSSMGRPKSSASSIKSVQTNSGAERRKVSGGSVASSATSGVSRSPVHTRPSSRGSTRTTTTLSTAPSRASRSTLSTISTTTGSSVTNSSAAGSRPASRVSLSSSVGGGRPVSSVSTRSSVSSTTDMTFRTASAGGGLTPIATGARSRKGSAASIVSTASVRTATSVSGVVRGRKVSTGSVSSVASVKSPRKAVEKAPPVPPLDPTKLAPGTVAGGKKAGSSVAARAKATSPSLKSSASSASLASSVAGKGRVGATPVKKVVSSPASSGRSEKRKEEVVEKEDQEENKQEPIPESIMSSPEQKMESLPASPEPSVKPKPSVADSLRSTATTVSSSGSSVSTATRSSEHKKTASSASNSSVSTLTMRRRDSVDTITSRTTTKSSEPPAASAQPRSLSPPLPALPQQEEEEEPPADYVPTGATLDIGIPCIVSCKRKRFKAYARYIGEVYGERGSWVGVEVPLPSWESGGSFGYSSMSSSATSHHSSFISEVDDRQWNDGTWGGIKYFEVSNYGGDDGWDDRAARRRRVDAGSVGGAVWGSAFGGKTLKREGDSLSVSVERMKKMRSVSPTISETSSMVESRGLFVRPQQVLYVVDAVGADL
ncbi:hypothetical protein FA15DRAFT_625369 [Coprinopsis marcescibilis]|uniref:BTB domain-containing protein n=1 Tax=Coprinopsis marcescibilis TaxID=230819 RepID=A0A5C3KJZ2_COPMA|nr:hypothetical protein FA15DRAFT_625369 [Coprinopsis marcescibilis]